MRKVLSLAILLLNLFVAGNVHAQSYSSELGVGDLIKKAWDNAQNSNADIYTEVYDDWGYEFNDYSEKGDFSQEVLFSDGIRYIYGLDEQGNKSNNYEYESVGYGGSGIVPLSKYDFSKLNTRNILVISNGNENITRRSVTNAMANRTKQTMREVVAIQLENGNYIIAKDKNSTYNYSEVPRDPGPKRRMQTYDGLLIINVYHTHPYVDLNEKNNPLYISPEDHKMASNMGLDYILIVDVDGHLYSVDKGNSNSWTKIY